VKDSNMTDTATRFDADTLADDAKWHYCSAIVELWESSVLAAIWCRDGRMTRDELGTTQSRLLNVAHEAYRLRTQCPAGACGRLEFVYSDGSPTWSRVTTTTGPATDADLVPYLDGDLENWVSNSNEGLPLGVSVVVNQPPHRR